MNKIILILLFLVLITSQKGITKQQLDKMLMKFNMSPLVSLLLIFDSTLPRADALQNLMSLIAEKRKGYFNVLMMDCNTDDAQVLSTFVYCRENIRKQLPALIFSQPSLNQDGTKEVDFLSGVKQYQGGLDDKSLFNFAVPLMKIYSVQIRTSRDLKKFQQSYPNVPKVVYFTDKQKIPPLFRALTAHFRNTIAFGHVLSGSQVSKDLGIKSFPLFLVNGKQKIEVKSNLTQIIQRFDIIKGQPTKIFIKQFDGTKNIQLTKDNLQSLVYKTPEYILIHVIGQDGKEHPQWTNITSKFNKMFKFYETFTLKETLGVKQTPALVYFPKSVAKKAVQKTIFTSKDTFENIYDQINSMVQDFTVPLSNFIEMQKLTSIHFQQGKLIVIFFHSKQIPLSYKAVSNENIFQEQLAFFRMKDPQQQVLQQYQIKKLPSLIIMMKDEQEKSEKPKKGSKQEEQGVKIKVATYNGRFTYSDLYRFFSTFIEKPKNQNEDTQNDQNDKNELQQITKSNKLKSKCQNGCFLLLVNGNSQNSERNTNYIGSFSKEVSKLSTNNYGYIDGACHGQFASAFDIPEGQLPAVVYVQPKFQKYTRMIGRVQQSYISSFISKVRSRKVQFRGYDKLNFDSKNCQQEHQRLKKLNEKTETISQQQAEILNQIRAQQQKRRQQFDKAQKEDKTRKKSKKKRPKKQYQEQEL